VDVAQKTTCREMCVRVGAGYSLQGRLAMLSAKSGAALLVIAAVAAGQATPAQIVSDTSGGITVSAPHNDITFTTSGSTCTASSLCGLMGQVTAMSNMLAQQSTAASTQLSTLVSSQTSTAQLAAQLSNQLTTANAQINSMAAAGPQNFSVTIGRGQASVQVPLGSVDRAASVLRIQLTAFGCGGSTSADLTVTGSFNPPPATGPGAGRANLTIAVLLVSPDSATRASPTTAMVDVQYWPGANGAVMLAATVRPIAACSAISVGGGGATTVSLAVRALLGTFTRGTTSTVVGQWLTAVKQPVGQLAALTETSLLRALSCQRTGRVWDSTAMQCISPSMTVINGVTQVVTTTAVTAATSQLTLVVALSTPTNPSSGFVGHTDYWCHDRVNGGATADSGVFSLSPIAGTSTVQSEWSSTTTQNGAVDFQWLQPTGSAQPLYRLMFNAPSRQECVITVRYWNATTNVTQRIAVVNPSFETYPTNTHYSFSQRQIPGWTPVGSSRSCGIFNPGPSHYSVANFAAQDGSNVLWSNGPCGATQTLGESFAANTFYKLTFWAFKRLDHPFGGYAAQLCAGPCASGTQVAVSSSRTFTPTPPYTQAMRVEVNYTAPASVPAGGITIDIRGAVVQSNFDRVSMIKMG